jgi:hypothetical protein
MRANFLAIICLLLLPASFVCADTKVLSLVDSYGSNMISVNVDTYPMEVQVRVDNAATVAEAAFTVTYDTIYLSLDAQYPISSSFFDTYSVDSTTRGTIISAARIENGTGNNITIFTLNFTAIMPGTYPISIVPTSESGEEIPMLVGIGTDDDLVHTVATPIIAYLVVDGQWEDLDNDGIDDGWEYTHTPAGTKVEDVFDVYSATGDYDHDGYTDLQEYLNRGELDPSGDLYDPEVYNAAGGTDWDVALIDSDNDGIKDSWEILSKADVIADDLLIPVLDVYSATGDYDNDGYTDLQEFLNYNRGEVFWNDPDHFYHWPFSPNMPGGTGHPDTIVVILDTDGDGIDDDWEIANIPEETLEEAELDIYTARGDYDNDGYTDRQEYLNDILNKLDPWFQFYHPAIYNAPGGTGYRVRQSAALPSIFLLLLGP